MGTIDPPANSVGITQLNLSDGSNGQFIKTDGSGTLSFATVDTSSATDSFTISGSTPTLTIGDAGAEDTKIVFDDDQQVNFVIPIQSRISIKNIQNENISELYYLKKLFIESKLEDDILFKQHIDKALYKVVLIPLSIFALIAYFGSLIFGSLRDLNIGARITIAVFGAFVYKLVQDLSIGIFISFNLSVLIGVMIPSILLALLAINSYRKI